MKRLIDADAYLKKVCTYNKTGCGSCIFQTKCPADEPTIDAEPVRHGKWIVWDEIVAGIYHTVSECSECGFTTDKMSREEMPYCPNCGAYMKGTEDD